MPTQMEILEKEEQDAMDALQKDQNPSEEEENGQSEKAEDVIPLTEVLKEHEKKQKKPMENEPDKKQEDELKAEAKDKKSESKKDVDYEKEFEALGYKLNPEKKDDPRYLTGKALTAMGLLKQVSSEKKQANEKFKQDLKTQEDKIAELQELLLEQKKSQKTKPDESTNDLDDFKKQFEEFDTPPEFIDKLEGRYGNQAEEIKLLQKEVKELLSSQENDRKDSYQLRFWDDVENKTPGSRTLPENILNVWLEQETNRKYVYEGALAQRDSKTVAKLIHDCLEDINKGNEKNDTIPTDIKSQISPKPIQTSSTQNIEGKPTFTEKQIKDFDNKKLFAIKRGDMTKEEVERYEDEIEAAYHEGRVR